MDTLSKLPDQSLTTCIHCQTQVTHFCRQHGKNHDCCYWRIEASGRNLSLHRFKPAGVFHFRFFFPVKRPVVISKWGVAWSWKFSLKVCECYKPQESAVSRRFLPTCVTVKLRAWTPQTREMSYSVFPLSKNNIKITSRHLCNLGEVSHTVKPVSQTWDFIKKKSLIQKFKLLLILFVFVLHLTQNSQIWKCTETQCDVWKVSINHHSLMTGVLSQILSFRWNVLHNSAACATEK